jgi:16S rRNA (uracil1498-N3)-methyltransferase
MREGEEILVSCNGNSSLCSISYFTADGVIAEIIEEKYNDTELPISIQLFQGLPKSDKMELIIQKSVELGVDKITPVQMSRSVVKLDDKKRAVKPPVGRLLPKVLPSKVNEAGFLMFVMHYPLKRL